MIDLLYLTHNRLEFTRQSLTALKANTNWDLVRNFWIYDDGSTDGTLEFIHGFEFPKLAHKPIHVISTKYGSPVAVMNDFLATKDPAPLFAKVDSDVMLPAKWLDTCLGLMDGVDLLGIEAMYPVATDGPRMKEPADYIGGIGLMRTEVFKDLPTPNGRFGFTSWQDKRPGVRKAWINPSLPVCLLDRMPLEPWRSLSESYVAQGWQRFWSPYGPEQSALWEWFR